MPGPHPAPLSAAVTVADQASRFRALHEDFLVLPNPWDAGTAALLAQAGFSAIASSSAAGAWCLAKPDGAFDRDGAVAHAAMLSAAAGLPVNGDFESGYGETPAEVARTIEAAIAAGVAGCSIEDIVTGGPEPLYDRKMACLRLEAAREAIERAGSDFVLTGRCEALAPYGKAGLAEALERVPLYVAAGAHVIYVPYLTERAEVEALLEASSVPVSVIAGLGGISDDLPALKELGVRRITVGSGLYKKTMASFFGAVEALAGGSVALSGGVPGTRFNAAFSGGGTGPATEA